jgi:hypothetical protein
MKKNKKDIETFDKVISKYIEKKKFVQVRRDFIDDEAHINGFILDVSEDFILVQSEEDFRLTGYAILHKNKFDSIQFDGIDNTVKKILKKEGVIAKEYGINKKINLSSWGSIFKNLKKLDFHVIIECEDKEDPIFLIGPIVKIDEKSVSIHNYDATGVFDDKPTKVKFKDITIVKFDERYANLFRKYLIK